MLTDNAIAPMLWKQVIRMSYFVFLANIHIEYLITTIKGKNTYINNYNRNIKYGYPQFKTKRGRYRYRPM